MRIIRIFGKETLATKLVISFCNEIKSEERVLIIDTICGKRLIPIHFGVEDETIYDIYDYFNGVVDFYKTFVEVDNSLGIIASSYLEDKLIAEEIDTKKLMEDAAEDYDVIIILANEAAKNWGFGDDCKNIQIYGRNNSISSIKGDNKIVVDNTDKLLSDGVHLQELKWLVEMGFGIVGVLEDQNSSQKVYQEIYQNTINDKHIEIKPKGFFNRIKEVFKND